MLRKLTSVLLAVGLLAGGSAWAVPVASADGAGKGVYVAADGNVTVTYEGKDAGFRSALYLLGADGEDTLVFKGKSFAAGTSFDLGDFTAGTELIFRLAIANRGGYSLYSGDGSRNAKGFANARAETIGGLVTRVSFEDMLGGGDKDFNDFGFTVSNSAAGAIPNPVPGAAIVMLTGIAGLAGMRSRRRTA
ncbi:DUF4114 domain-containing protein [Parvularcula dongshanensis]|uniref:DUF4114 domain-containing protein n=1 Tax=Parvularcula dongshanensis TaxID=1173995 RepID=A0A840I0B6_9PROT|nr:DUF4114 domain-containing protein [Parvularcula dongshanensis]MBB4658269.1 hypothetical protein [Parvularcula dongshanensis]